MPAAHVELERRFRDAVAGEAAHHRWFVAASGGGLTWSDLLKQRRVVILAEAGSGKTSELSARTVELQAGGHAAFFVTVRDVAQHGLEASLKPADRGRFQVWTGADEQPGFFLIDSVDEAKDQGHYFEDAARRLEHAIAGREQRSHLYISSRYTDWDATADRKVMETWLSLPQPPPPPPPDFAQEVRDVLHRREPPAQEPVEPISVVVLQGLTSDQVRRYSEAAGLSEVDRFLQEIDDGDLWSLAARPLDLEWMTEHWRARGRLGPLREMLADSLTARLSDPAPRRRRTDLLNPQIAKAALERIGAAFLFCGKDTVRVPAEGVDLAAAEGTSVPLAPVLPDWSDAHKLALLSRPVFDPATLGRARLHNDNEGVLRCYLAARWLAERLGAGCPTQSVFDLLFADVYGHALVRPDMLQTSAWLAGKSPAVADELIRRSPFNLLCYGDPGSLPIPTRVRAFEGALSQVADLEFSRVWFQDQNLKRFSDPALDPHIPRWWRRAQDVDARHLVLRLIHLGRQKGGLRVVRSVALDRACDEISQIIALRALVTLGSSRDRARLARHLKLHHRDLPRTYVLQALDSLLLNPLSIRDFFHILDAVGVKDEGGIGSVHPLGPQLPANLGRQRDLQTFLEQVVARCGELRDESSAEPFRSAFAELSIAAALRLLEFHPDDVPDVVTDLVLLLHDQERRSGTEGDWTALRDAFGATPGRRSSSAWRAVERLQGHPWIQSPDDLNLWLLQHLGWPVSVEAADFEWLIDAAATRPEARDRRIALAVAHDIWRHLDGGDGMSARLEAVASADPTLDALLTRWRAPPPEVREHAELREQQRIERQKHADEIAQRDQSWIELIGSLRDDPSVLESISPATVDAVDGRLYHLWRFLSARTHSRNRYSIDDLSAVAPVFGPEVTRRFRDALIAFAYARTPGRRIEVSQGGGSVSTLDLMALTGMSLGAAASPVWAETLDGSRAETAARLALLELNGFPDYLLRLAAAHPRVVRDVLMEPISEELAAEDSNRHGLLDQLPYADASLARLLVADLEQVIEDQPSLPVPTLGKVTAVLNHASPRSSPRLQAIASERARRLDDPVRAGWHLVLLFGLDAEGAVDAFVQAMETLDRPGRRDICCTVLPQLFGHRLHRTFELSAPLSVAALVKLLRLAYEGVRPEEDNDRPSGRAYSPDLRDDAESARSAVFDRLAKTPGEATHAALQQLADAPGFPVEAKWLRRAAWGRAEADAELSPWKADDVVTFERTFSRAPTTTVDLQVVAARRIAEMQHDLIHGRFSQGDTLKSLPDENAVQRWLATSFEAKQASAFTVHRETHFADEKEPDLVLVSRHSGVELPIEVKVVDELSIRQLEDALLKQLCGQYLRHNTTPHGVLLLIYQHARPSGWIMVDGQSAVLFEDVLAHLRELARSVRETSATGPQPIVEALDVSRVVTLQAKRRAARADQPRRSGRAPA